MKVEVVVAHSGHICSLAERMRESDRQEVYAAMCLEPHAALQRSLDASRYAFTGLIDNKPVCMFGVGAADPLAPSIGRPWMLGTDLIDKFPRTFLRRCRAFVRMMLEVYPILRNYVDVRNERAVQWLIWLGFTMFPAEPFGPFQMPFSRFEMRR